jgi:hypothetical protein
VGRANQCPPELWERAVRMVAEVTPDYSSQGTAITSVAQKLGIGTAETLPKWVLSKIPFTCLGHNGQLGDGHVSAGCAPLSPRWIGLPGGSS